MAKIYTKTGDNGTMGTLNGRISKADQLANTLGTIDELNSWLGFLRTQPVVFFEPAIHDMQNNLMIIASNLAGSHAKKFNPREVTKLEKFIDELTQDLPKLTNFIYPVGPIHVARTVSRRLEREVVALGVSDKTILQYLNRLSDVLFTLARWVNWRLGVDEEAWK